MLLDRDRGTGTRRLKVLVLSNLYPPDVIGGYERGCAQVVDALRARGHEVRVLTGAARTPAPNLPHVRRSLRLANVYDPTNANRDDVPFVNAANVYVLASTLEEFRPDVAYVWNLVGLGGLGLMGCLGEMGVPWVWHLMDCVPSALCCRGGRVAPALVRELAARLQGRFLACSQKVIDEIEESGISLRGRVELLPNWVRGERPPERSRYYQSGRLRVVTAGQVGRHKGVDLLIEAVGLLRSHGNLCVDVFGTVVDPSIPRRITELGLEGVVRLHGPRPLDELLALYREQPHDVFAFPTWEREPFAFAPLEAAAHGIVPLLTHNCGNAEWFVHGVDCLKAERTPAAFAAALAGVLDGRTDLAPLARRAAAVVWRDFRLELLLPQVEAALRRARRERSPTAATAAETYCRALVAEKLLRECDPLAASLEPGSAREEVCHAA